MCLLEARREPWLVFFSFSFLHLWVFSLSLDISVMPIRWNVFYFQFFFSFFFFKFSSRFSRQLFFNISFSFLIIICCCCYTDIQTIPLIFSSPVMRDEPHCPTLVVKPRSLHQHGLLRHHSSIWYPFCSTSVWHTPTCRSIFLSKRMSLSTTLSIWKRFKIQYLERRGKLNASVALLRGHIFFSFFHIPPTRSLSLFFFYCLVSLVCFVSKSHCEREACFIHTARKASRRFQHSTAPSPTIASCVNMTAFADCSAVSGCLTAFLSAGSSWDWSLFKTNKHPECSSFVNAKSMDELPSFIL